MSKQTEIRLHKAKVIPFHIDGEFFLKKGIKAYRNRQFDRAIQLLKRAHEIEPEDPMILCQLAAVLSEVGQYQLSNEYLKIVIEELDSEMVECYYFISNNYAHLGLFHEAKKNALKYLDLAPDGEFIEDTEDLLDVLSFEVDVDDDEDELLFLQDHARDLMESKKFHEAILVFNELIENYPQFWSAYNNLALANFYVGEVDKSLHIIEEVLEKNPGNLHAMCNQLVIYYYLRKEENVDELVNKLRVVHPILIEHRYKLGATFGMIGRYDLALPWLLSLKRSGFEGDATFYYWLCYSAFHHNQEQLARYSWSKVLTLGSDKVGMAPWEQLAPTIEKLDGKEIYSLYLQLKNNSTMTSIEDLAFQHGFQVADLLFERLGNQEELLSKLLIKWFAIFPDLSDENLRNSKALAAAIEYSYFQEEGLAVTKKAIAEEYKISPATSRKYILLLAPYFQN